MAKADFQQLRLDDVGERPTAEAALPMERAQRWKAIGAALLCYAVICGIFLAFFYTPPFVAIVGLPALQTVTSPIQFSLLDREETRNQRERILRERPQIWIRHGKVISSALQRLDGFFKLYDDKRPSTPEELRRVLAALRSQQGLQLDETGGSRFMDAPLNALNPPLSRSDVRRDLEFVINEVLLDHKIVENKVRFQAHVGQHVLVLVDDQNLPLGDKVDPQTVLAWPAETRSYISSIALPKYLPGDDQDHAALRQAATDLLMQILAPNLTNDASASNKINERRLDELKESGIVKTFEPGELIVKQGEQMTVLQSDALKFLNRERASNMVYKIVGILLFVATIFFAVGVYLRRFRRDLTLNASTITLHALPPLIAIIVGSVTVKLGGSSDLVSIWFPSILVGSLSTLLITPQVAFILVLVSALTFGIVMGQDVSFMVVALFQGFAAVLATRQVRARLEILRVGLKVGIVNLFTMTLVALLKQQLFANPWYPMISFSTAMLYSVAAYFLIGLFEKMFGVVTDLRLLELTGLQHRLLQMLEEKAPGSFQHVLNVTKLAEAAANAIGANYLLVRAGAYFHDIGKMLSPKYFSENQTSIEDKKSHSRISPYMSVLIIKNHVKEGVKLAKEFKPPLPQRVIDFIPEHHGTSLIRYFYAEALKRYEESEAVDPVREEDFRYPGPKPRSVETAIVMIADTVEAVTTAKFTGGQVQENDLRRVVQGAITEKFNDGQFDECNLTLRHLHLIREALVHALIARFHFRVQYPSLPTRPAAAVQTVPVRDAAPAISVSGPAA